MSTAGWHVAGEGAARCDAVSVNTGVQCDFLEHAGMHGTVEGERWRSDGLDALADVSDPSRSYGNGYRKALEWAADVVHAEADQYWARDAGPAASQMVAQAMLAVERTIREGLRGSDA